MKKIFLLIIFCTLFNNNAFAEENYGLKNFENLNQFAATPEDKILMTSFSDLIKEKYQETKNYPKIIGNGIPASFLLFEDGEVALVLNMATIQMGNDSNDDITNFFKILIKKVGKKNIRSYYLNNDDNPNQDNMYIRVRLK